MTDDNDNVTKLFTVSDKDVNELIKSLESLKRSEETIIKYGNFVAHLRRKSYEAYLKEGFDPVQALILCKDII